MKKLLLVLVALLALVGGSAFDGSGATIPPEAANLLPQVAQPQTANKLKGSFPVLKPVSAHRAQGVNYTYCNMYTEGQTCKSPWGYNYAAYITNGSQWGSSSVYCFAHHPDGSWTGGVVYVYGGETKSLWPDGYNQVVCVANTGPGAYPISIRTYQ